VLIRAKRSPIRAADFNIAHLHDRYAAPAGSPAIARFEAVLGEPSAVPRHPPRYVAPELRLLLAAGNNNNDLAAHRHYHTAATDAYAFAAYALDLIDVASSGLYAGLGRRSGDLRVVYVELLKGLEDVLGAEYELPVEGEGGAASASSSAVSSSAAAGGGGVVEPRTKAMDNFLQLTKDVVSGGVVLDGHYPVPESSRWYCFSTAFPCVYDALGMSMHHEENWFQREKVLLYYIYRPRGWSWNTDASSSGSEHDGDEPDLWDHSDEGTNSVKSGFTEP
jgi:hypothetical protein